MPVVGSGLGPVVQLAYVVDDLHEAVRQWSSKLGVGPFFIVDRAKYTDHEVHGVRGPLELSMALAYSGEMQIELMQQHGNDQSMLRAYPAQPATGFHHVGIFSSDIARDEARLSASGLSPVGSSVSSIGVRVAFFHGGPQAGGLIELIQANGAVNAFSESLKRAAAQWDGSSPYTSFAY
jgi:methylmalonyl-CoA/ethylmalonyl-CoA epimerase